MIRAVLFDAGGTLIRVRGSVGAVYAGVAAGHGVEVDADEIEARFRAAFAQMPPLCFPAEADAELPQLERNWWKQLVRDVFAGVDVPDFDAYFNELFDYFADPQSWELYGDVRSALEALEGRGVRMGVVSNFDFRLQRILEGKGIAPFFDAIVLSARSGYAKPDPLIFRAAVEKLAASTSEALHVGDSEEEDVRGAEAAGLRALLVVRRGLAAGPGQIDDLRRLVDKME
jgi:putative hydrolase of the HAD superfamily